MKHKIYMDGKEYTLNADEVNKQGILIENEKFTEKDLEVGLKVTRSDDVSDDVSDNTNMVDYKYIIQYKHNGKWWVTAQTTNLDNAQKFMDKSKKEFGYEYRTITFEQYEQESKKS